VATVVIIGAQWGDEGKGKVVDALASRAEIVARYQGGNNAGHTLVVDGAKTVLHLVPSGILQRSALNVIAQGTVIDPEVLLGELAALQERGLLGAEASERLKISDRAAVIMPYHVAIDKLREARLAGGKLGTTGRGIGPTYEDVAARRAVRVADLLDRQTLLARLDRVLPEKNGLLAWLGGEAMDRGELVERGLALGRQLAPFITDTGRLLRERIAAGANVLFEGAQGVLLDVLHGTYPFVTSSHTFTGGVSPGAGISPFALDGAIGVVKAYTTRVGSGPFVTELLDQVGEHLRAVGHEYGATTGRPRRCGWLDLPALRYCQGLNGFTALALTKLDVLTGMDEVGLCTAYLLDGALHQELPVGADLSRAEPVIERLPGWREDLSRVRRVADLPLAARGYVARISEEVGAPVALVGVGPGREETILEHDLWTPAPTADTTRQGSRP
jgi:adenylosuccinate synthase